MLRVKPPTTQVGPTTQRMAQMLICAADGIGNLRLGRIRDRWSLRLRCACPVRMDVIVACCSGHPRVMTREGRSRGCAARGSPVMPGSKHQGGIHTLNDGVGVLSPILHHGIAAILDGQYGRQRLVGPPLHPCLQAIREHLQWANLLFPRQDPIEIKWPWCLAGSSGSWLRKPACPRRTAAHQDSA